MNPDDTQNLNDPSFGEDLKQALKELPPPLRAYVLARKYTPVVKSLMTKYLLHIDQAAILEREVILLLLAIVTTEDFAAALKTEASIPDETIRNILIDLNDQIFVPLRDEMRNPKNTSAPAPRPNASMTSAPRPVSQSGAPSSPRPLTPPQPPRTMPTQPPKEIIFNPQPRPVQPAPAPAAVSSRPVQSTSPTPIAPTHTMQPPTSAGNGMLPSARPTNVAPLPPKIVLPKSSMSTTASSNAPRPMLPVGEGEMPREFFVRTPAPRPYTPPQNLPGSMPPASIPPAAPVPPAAPKPQTPPPAPAKPYSADPYREPIQ